MAPLHFAAGDRCCSHASITNASRGVATRLPPACPRNSGRNTGLNGTRTYEVLMIDQNPNPKLDPNPGSNTEKDPDDWVSGDEPMTGAQASYLTTLCEEAKVKPPAKNLSKAEASKLIDKLKTKLGR